MTLQCCKCRKLKEKDSWTHGELHTATEVSHTYCPACLTEALEEIRESRTVSEEISLGIGAMPAPNFSM